MGDGSTYAFSSQSFAFQNIHPCSINRVLRMTLLALEIVEVILAGRQPEGLTMTWAMQPFPVMLKDQRTLFTSSCR
jgi:hypothetical protein